VRALKGLGAYVARCIVWDIDDDEARLYLATLNRLTDEEIPERRAALLEELLGAFGREDLAALLPESERQLDELESIVGNEGPALSEEPVGADSHPVILDFMVDSEVANAVNVALDLIQRASGNRLDTGEALGHLAQSYLDRVHQSHTEGLPP
jgi:hypothetical protein